MSMLYANFVRNFLQQLNRSLFTRNCRLVIVDLFTPTFALLCRLVCFRNNFFFEYLLLFWLFLQCYPYIPHTRTLSNKILVLYVCNANPYSGSYIDVTFMQVPIEVVYTSDIDEQNVHTGDVM